MTAPTVAHLSGGERMRVGGGTGTRPVRAALACPPTRPGDGADTCVRRRMLG